MDEEQRKTQQVKVVDVAVGSIHKKPPHVAVDVAVELLLDALDLLTTKQTKESLVLQLPLLCQAHLQQLPHLLPQLKRQLLLHLLKSLLHQHQRVMLVLAVDEDVEEAEENLYPEAEVEEEETMQAVEVASLEEEEESTKWKIKLLRRKKFLRRKERQKLNPTSHHKNLQERVEEDEDSEEESLYREEEAVEKEEVVVKEEAEEEEKEAKEAKENLGPEESPLRDLFMCQRSLPHQHPQKPLISPLHLLLPLLLPHPLPAHLLLPHPQQKQLLQLQQMLHRQ